MKIAYVITRGDSVGGASIHVRDLAAAMRERGHEVLVLLGGTGPVTAELARRGVPFRTVPSLQKAIHPLRDALAVVELTRALREFRPDLVSAHTAKAGFVGRAAARRLGVPAVFTPHGWAVGDRLGRAKGRVFTVAERLVAPWTAAFIDVCEAERELALSRGIGDAARHHVIYNGVHDIAEELRARPGGTEDGPVRIVSVARFEAPKDHDTLFEAVARLRGDWRLDLVGDGPREAEFRARFAGDPRIVFHGYLPDPAPALARAQLFVLASRSEGFPRSILEAMRAGLPVIASGVGGVREAVTEANGVVVPPGDPVSLYSAIQELLQFPLRRQRLGDRGHLIYHEQFRFERTLAATELLYGQVT